MGLYFFMFFLKRKLNRGTGAVLEPYSKQDYRLEEVFTASPVDWKRGFDIEEEMGIELPTRNQGSSSACVSMAWAYYSEVLDYLESRQWMRESARYIYSSIYLPTGGAYLRKGGQVLTNKGEVPEALVPDKKSEIEMRNDTDITSYDNTIAKTLLKTAYASFDAKTIDDMASVIKTHYGAVGGVIDGFEYEDWHRIIVRPGNHRNKGHALYFGKYKMLNGKKYLAVKNSWGDDYGKKGWQWLGEEWIGRMFNLKTIIDLPNVVKRKKTKPKCYFLHNLRVGMNNDEVKCLQKTLDYLSLFNYPKITGYFGGITLKSVKAYQILRGIPATGYVGPMTRKKLNSEFR